MRTYRILIPSLAIAFTLTPCVVTSQGTPVPVRPGIRVDVGDPKFDDALRKAVPPTPLTGSEIAARLATLGVASATVSDDKPLRLTVVSPRQPSGNLELRGATTNTESATGSAHIGYDRAGAVTVTFNTEPGARYVIDFSIGYVPCRGCAPDESHRFYTTVWGNLGSGSDAAFSATQRQEFVFPRSAQHVLIVGSANSRRMRVMLASYRNPPTDSAPPVDPFVFYSAQVSKLR
jgi:hypothetical protein